MEQSYWPRDIPNAIEVDEANVDISNSMESPSRWIQALEA